MLCPLLPIISALGISLLLASTANAQTAVSKDSTPTLRIEWPVEGSTVTLRKSPEQAIGLVVSSNFTLKPAGQCGNDPRCGHIHLKIDPDSDRCNQPGKPYNSMNSDWGGPLVAARFGYCAQSTGPHVIGILLANDQHQPVLVDGKPVTALVNVTTR